MNKTTKWEYQVLTIGSVWKGIKDEDLQIVFNELGAEGWEVVSVHTPGGASNKVTVVGKRPLSESTRRQRSMP